MKATGIVRKIDDLGRVVIPKEIRRNYELEEQTPVEIFVDADLIIIRKYITHCALCGDEHAPTELRKYKAADICDCCYNSLN